MPKIFLSYLKRMLICILYKFPLFIRGSVSLEVTQRFLSYNRAKNCFRAEKNRKHYERDFLCYLCLLSFEWPGP